MARETSGDSEHAGALSALQKQLGFQQEDNSKWPQREPETVVDPRHCIGAVCCTLKEIYHLKDIVDYVE